MSECLSRFSRFLLSSRLLLLLGIQEDVHSRQPKKGWLRQDVKCQWTRVKWEERLGFKGSHRLKNEESDVRRRRRSKTNVRWDVRPEHKESIQFPWSPFKSSLFLRSCASCFWRKVLCFYSKSRKDSSHSWLQPSLHSLSFFPDSLSLLCLTHRESLPSILFLEKPLPESDDVSFHCLVSLLVHHHQKSS